jgi:hypothetical protein
MAGFLLRGHPTVARTATPISSVGRVLAIRVWNFTALGRDQKLFPHFGETGTAIFAVKQVKYGGHDRTPLFDLTINSHAIISLGMQGVI